MLLHPSQIAGQVTFACDNQIEHRACRAHQSHRRTSSIREQVLTRSSQSKMPTSAAADRIAALQRHLQSTSLESVSESSLEVQVTKAESDPKDRPAPGGGPGTLSVKDSRTGKTYDIPISDHGTIKGTDLKKITAGGDGVGIRPYDPG